MAVGGDSIEITYNHPTLGSGTIFPKSAEDSNYDLGGFKSDDDKNMIDGGGTMIDKLSRARWMFEVLCAWDANVDLTLEKIAALAAHPVPANWTFQNINGTVYSGLGKPVGDIAGNMNASTFTLKVSGGGILKQI